MPKLRRGKMRKGCSRCTARSTKGWRRAKPNRISQRRAILQHCGRGAFLQIRRTKTGLVNPKYPIVAKSAATGGPCVPDCRGLWAARQRASQQRLAALARRALRKARAAGCRWAQGE